MDAVGTLLKETSARDLTMEAVAKRAGVGKPTLYKWWPSKSALILAMFHERMARDSEPAVVAGSTEENIRRKVRGIVRAFSGPFGRVLADLIAEGQNEPTLLAELYGQHILPRRKAILADVERGMAAGEFAADTNAGGGHRRAHRRALLPLARAFCAADRIVRRYLSRSGAPRSAAGKNPETVTSAAGQEARTLYAN